MNKIKLKIRIANLNKSFVRDIWGNVTDIYWNEMIKQDILKLEKEVDNWVNQ